MTGSSEVAYSGEPGAFAEDAAIAAFGDVARIGLPGFREVFEAVAGGRVVAGVLPIENLVGGTIRETYDLLLEHGPAIVGEVVVPVRLCLAALPGQRLEEIERVYSHVQALGQAERFLRTQSWTLLTTYNTAGAGRIVAERRETGAAALLSPRAAETFGLEILADGVQDVADNRTRFLVVTPAGGAGSLPEWQAPRSEARRTMLVFGVRNQPGTLLGALRVFAERGVNLSKLESRPSRERAWEYVFWADLDAGVEDPVCAAAIDELRGEATMVRVLGSHPRSRDD